MRVWFVCSANRIRSPIAERLFPRLLERRGLEGVEVHSGGVFAVDGEPASEAAVRVARVAGIDLSDHRSRRFDGREVGPSDLVLVMEPRHRDAVLLAADLDHRAVRLLGRFGGAAAVEAIVDPVGLSDEEHSRCVDRIAACLEGLAVWLEDERISRA